MQGKREQTIKILALGVSAVYRKREQQIQFEAFRLTFNGELDSHNRWVLLSQLIPWYKLEDQYAAHFAESGLGPEAKPVRMALGALIIKEKCGFSDEELVLQIAENPYLQYFIGLPKYEYKAPFDPSMMVHFRKRFPVNVLMEINEMICLRDKPVDKDKSDKQDDPPAGNVDLEKKTENKGTLIVDATCAPADIRFPTDLGLLNEAREKLEAMIDTMHEPMVGKARKPRTYRKQARRDFLNAIKNKKPKKNALRKAIGKQLRYVERDLNIIERLWKKDGYGSLNERQLQTLETINTLYAQQKTMHEQRTHQIENRIVSISQPYVRPIVRGKAAASTEFGAKLTISVCDGFTFVDRLSWDNFNEGVNLIEQLDAFRRRFGHDPEAVMADKIYRNRENRKICQIRHIRLSGPPLGRPNLKLEKAQKKLEQMDNGIRNRVEGKFGEGKRRYGLGRVMAKLKETNESVIVLQFLVMNLEHMLRLLFVRFTEAVRFIVFVLFGTPPGACQMNWG